MASKDETRLGFIIELSLYFQKKFGKSPTMRTAIDKEIYPLFSQKSITPNVIHE